MQFFWIQLPIIGQSRKKVPYTLKGYFLNSYMICCIFMDKFCTHLTSLKALVRPKAMVGQRPKYYIYGLFLVAKTHWNMITKEEFWEMIVIQKYKVLGMSLYWIQRDRKNNRCLNNLKDLRLEFPLIGNQLSWQVDNHTEVRVGIDGIKGQQIQSNCCMRVADVPEILGDLSTTIICIRNG